jgi:hypothetical protein
MPHPKHILTGVLVVSIAAATLAQAAAPAHVGLQTSTNLPRPIISPRVTQAGSVHAVGDCLHSQLHPTTIVLACGTQSPVIFAWLALASLGSSPAKPALSAVSLRVDESRQDGYAQEAFTIAVAKGAQPIKSLTLGAPGGLEYEEVRTGLRITTGSTVVRFTAKHVEDEIWISFPNPARAVHVTITSPAIVRCVAGLFSQTATVEAMAIDARRQSLRPPPVTTQITRVSPPKWWHPSQSAQQSVC